MKKKTIKPLKEKIKESLKGIYYALPIQLVVIQIRNHKTILVFWAFLFLTITNNFGSNFGINFLFLEPEYLGEVSFWSMFLIGIGLGTFMLSYQIATYILDSYRFNFLALKDMPFFIFVINNSLIPIAFFILYIIKLWQFQLYCNDGFTSSIPLMILGLITGIIFIHLLISVYLHKTNKDITKFFPVAMVQELRRPRVILDKARASMNLRYRVDYYLNPKFRFQAVNKSIPVQFRRLVKVLNQNHGNALLLELMLIIVIVVLSLLEKNPFFQIPSGLSILLIFSMILMFIAAFTFWFRKIGMLSLILAVMAFYFLDFSGLMNGRHPAYGMNYQVKPAEYSSKRIAHLSRDENWNQDFQQTKVILDRWKNNCLQINPLHQKPKAVIIMTSGGGLRASYFTMRSLQILDSLTQGQLWGHTRLITGASGGMIGAGIYRELALKRSLNQVQNINGQAWAEKVSHDLLNRIAFKIATGIFLPGLKEKVGNKKYLSDRGFSFDDQLTKNLGLFENKRLSDYQVPEANASIPMMIFSPVIVNDGRKLFVSSTPTAYMTRPISEKVNKGAGITGIEFRRFFEEQEADSILFVTAMRMNASFPLITPYIQLPSEPPLEVIDAGISDNYGIHSALKFLNAFEDWFEENTSGVMLIQIRDSERKMVQPNYMQKSLLGRFLDPVGAAYHSFSASKEITAYEKFEFMDDWYHGDLEMISIEYFSEDTVDTKAALSWHLTQKEKEHMEMTLSAQKNQEKFEYIRQWLKEDH